MNTLYLIMTLLYEIILFSVSRSKINFLRLKIKASLLSEENYNLYDFQGQTIWLTGQKKTYNVVNFDEGVV